MQASLLPIACCTVVHSPEPWRILPALKAHCLHKHSIPASTLSPGLSLPDPNSPGFPAIARICSLLSFSLPPDSITGQGGFRLKRQHIHSPGLKFQQCAYNPAAVLWPITTLRFSFHISQFIKIRTTPNPDWGCSSECIPSVCGALGSKSMCKHHAAPPYFLSKLLIPKPTPAQLTFPFIFLSLGGDTSSSPVINQQGTLLKTFMADACQSATQAEVLVTRVLSPRVYLGTSCY